MRIDEDVPRPSLIKRVSEVPTVVRRTSRTGEPLGVVAHLSASSGLKRLRIEHEVLAPGRRSSSPHTHTTREEMVYVLRGTPDLWLDGVLHRMTQGDYAAFVPGGSVAHAIVNNSDSRVELLVIATASDDDTCIYPAPSSGPSTAGQPEGQ